MFDLNCCQFPWSSASSITILALGKLDRCFRAKPKLAVYSHLVFLSSEKVPRATVDDIVAGTRETYDEPLQVGEDLMSFEIGDTAIMRKRNP